MIQDCNDTTQNEYGIVMHHNAILVLILSK